MKPENKVKGSQVQGLHNSLRGQGAPRWVRGMLAHPAPPCRHLPGKSAGATCRRAWEDLRGPGGGSLHVGEERPGLGVEGRQAHSQDSGSRPDKTAREDLLLSGSWQTSTIRTANHTVCNLCNWLGICGISRPLNSDWTCRFLSDRTGRESGWSTKRDRSESLGGDGRQGQP